MKVTGRPRKAVVKSVRGFPSKTDGTPVTAIEFELRTGERIFQYVSWKAEWLVNRYVRIFKLRSKEGTYNANRIVGRECKILIRDSHYMGRHSFYADLLEPEK